MKDEQFSSGSATEQSGDRSFGAEPVAPTTERPDQHASGAVRPRRHPARLGTIVWGFLVTAFAVAVALTTDLVEIEDPTAWLIGGLVVAGAALIAAGIAASLRRSV